MYYNKSRKVEHRSVPHDFHRLHNNGQYSKEEGSTQGGAMKGESNDAVSGPSCEAQVPQSSALLSCSSIELSSQRMGDLGRDCIVLR